MEEGNSTKNPTSKNTDDEMVDDQMEDCQSMTPISIALSPKGINPTPISFREAVAYSSQWFSEARNIAITTLDWEEQPEELPNSNLFVKFTLQMLSRLHEPWKLTLMGRCLGLNIRPSFMASRTKIMWKVKSSLETIDVGNNVYLFRFSTLDDYERALYGGPWFILDHHLVIFKWKPNFRSSIINFDVMSVWIRFPELPVEYYDKEAFFQIAKKVGIPIRVDYATGKLLRARYARVCIEINMANPLITKVWVGGGWQHVQYENIHSLCFSCGKIGHLIKDCKQMTKFDPTETVHGSGPQKDLAPSMEPTNPMVTQHSLEKQVQPKANISKLNVGAHVEKPDEYSDGYGP
ncbi:uncharacterized protein LOC110710436 [Chenopodium quinoa]|uniref:uncharacterized protein LOC110710436 n=1 Tax=Chenopodium quinoa TaxID=63459 RepID=UPI000B77E7EB|nr:uncharacterized protein LOC110710436 [Chenopodium quinoa]